MVKTYTYPLQRQPCMMLKCRPHTVQGIYLLQPVLLACMFVCVTSQGHWAICCFSQQDKGRIQSRGAQVGDQTDQGRLGLASLVTTLD